MTGTGSRAKTAEKSGTLAARLLAWYDGAARDLPWRVPPRAKARPDPYRVWLSEIMLQQTGVVAVIPYFQAFVARWPNVRALAAASQDEVLAAWAGLGYYARARNLLRTAQAIAATGGKFPSGADLLQDLPGIGPYTAAAIAAIAFDWPLAAIDGNVLRVVARLRDVATPLPRARPILKDLTEELVPRRRPGDFAQALMDLGATICTPRAPSCPACPWRTHCQARAAGTVAARPARLPKKPRPLRRGAVFWAERPDGAVLLRQRPAEGLLGGMLELPTSAWIERPPADLPADAAPLRAAWRRVPGQVRHVFTHFSLELEVYAAMVPQRAQPRAMWVAPTSFASLALPSLMRKVARHALAFRAVEQATGLAEATGRQLAGIAPGL